MVPTCAPAENARPCAFFAKAGPISPKTKRQGQGTLVSRIRKKGWASPLHILVFSHVEGTTQSSWSDRHAGWESSCWVGGAGTRLRSHNRQIPLDCACPRSCRSEAAWPDRRSGSVCTHQRTHCRTHAVHARAQGIGQ